MTDRELVAKKLAEIETYVQSHGDHLAKLRRGQLLGGFLHPDRRLTFQK